MWPLLAGVHQTVQREGADSDLSPSPQKHLFLRLCFPSLPLRAHIPPSALDVGPRYPWPVIVLNHSAGLNTADFVLPNKQTHFFGPPHRYFCISFPGFSSTCSLNEDVCLHSILDLLFLLSAGSQSSLPIGVILGTLKHTAARGPALEVIKRAGF